MIDWARMTRLAWDALSPAQLRKMVTATGPTNPVGDANKKVQTGATYRPVGPTCPSSCPQFPKEGQKPTCFALSGNVALHSKKASSLAAPSLRAAVIGIVGSAKWGRPARLHVSGDFHQDGEIDHEYIEGLIAIGLTTRALSHLEVVAWTYTHAHNIPWNELRQAGIVVRYSGSSDDWGAVVYPGPNPAKKAREIGAVYCPEQAVRDHVKATGRWTDYSCMDCRKCWEKPKLILFRPSNGAVPVADMGVAGE